MELPTPQLNFDCSLLICWLWHRVHSLPLNSSRTRTLNSPCNDLFFCNLYPHTHIYNTGIVFPWGFSNINKLNDVKSDKGNSSKKANLAYRIQTWGAHLNKQADCVLKSCFPTMPEFGKVEKFGYLNRTISRRHHQLVDRWLAKMRKS